MTMTAESLLTVRTVGGLLPTDLLDRVAAGRDLPGLSTADYQLPAGTSPREAANRAWTESLAAWQMFRTALAALPEGDRATTLTRERWLGVLLRQLGFNELHPTPAGGIAADDRAFPVSHLDGAIPIHLLGWNVASLDQRSPGVAGAADKAPHAMVQELLNRSDDHLWALLSNGRTLRLLRDATSLVGQSYVEFDLEAMFDGEIFSDFVVLYLTCHRTRFQPIDPDNSPEDWLERWRNDAVETGTRALDLLRDGVENALTTLGTGFLRHPDNTTLRTRLASGELELRDYHRALLRLVYRLVFCFVAEDRGLILRPDAEPVAVDRYHDYFSTRRLRRVAQRRHGTRHADLWQTVTLLFELLGRDQEASELGLGALGGLFESGKLDEILETQQLTNAALLEGIRHLSIVQPKAEPRRAIDFRNLGAEELGSIYESLLELVPRHDPESHEFALTTLSGNERKRTGSYYTPTSLITCLLDTALDPLLDRAENSADPQVALLALTVCDPACGSGHFLVAAAKRIASRLARHRSGGTEPSAFQAQAAMRDVVAHCIYGVDIDPMAIELTKVGLWLEAVEPGKPLTFLDAHLRIGNSLLGTTPALLAEGIPDDAFTAIAGDEKKHTTALKARNRKARAGQAALPIANTWLTDEARRLDELPAGSLEDVHVAIRRLREINADAHRQQATLLADTWCAAFVAAKRPDRPAITGELLERWTRQMPADDDPARREVKDLAEQYRFFHWHLEFPQIFSVPDDPAGTEAGWLGGFDCVVGNPPWEQVEFKEQEFFAATDSTIATAVGVIRKQLVRDLADTNPALAYAFSEAKRRADGERTFVSKSNRFPYCGKGHVNTYALFAETDRLIVDFSGGVGLVAPTGIATHSGTSAFFADIVMSGRLRSLYDFENSLPLFEGVHRSFKFVLLTLSGRSETSESTQFSFFLTHPDQLSLKERVFSLSREEIAILNPNTNTCPVFRSRRDAEISLKIYRHGRVFVNDEAPDGNPWQLNFMPMFHMSNDSSKFSTRETLEKADWHLHGNIFARGSERMLPLYEAKLAHQYDHRWATYEDGRARDVTDEERADPSFTVMPRYWVKETDVDARLSAHSHRSWLIGFRDITNSTNERTMVGTLLPIVGVGARLPLMFVASACAPVLQATFNSFAVDYVARQKISGTVMTFFAVKQLPVFAPETFTARCAWDSASIADWILPRLVELDYTEWGMHPFAVDFGYDGAPFKWNPLRRSAIRAELDAGFFHLYDLDRDDTNYILGTFTSVNRKDVAVHGEERTRRLILENYDRMAAATSERPFVSSLDPPPGQGPRHPERASAHG
jgi:hypothetical protein